MCKEPGCKRRGQGFTTVNDLDRHRKSVHRIGLLKKSYQCASENCRNREKIWPRLDNFKQHIERMHKDEDELDLIKRYSEARNLHYTWLTKLDLPSYLSSLRVCQRVFPWLPSTLCLLGWTSLSLVRVVMSLWRNQR